MNKTPNINKALRSIPQIQTKAIFNLTFSLSVVFLSIGCSSKNAGKSQFEAKVTVQDGTEIIEPQPEVIEVIDPELAIDLDKAKQNWKNFIDNSTLSPEAKVELVAFIEDYQISQEFKPTEFVDELIAGIISRVPNEDTSEVLEIATKIGNSAVNHISGADETRKKEIRSQIISETITVVAQNFVVSESEIDAIVKDAILNSGAYSAAEIDQVVSGITKEVLADDQVASKIASNSNSTFLKLTMDNCKDPDLSKLLTTASLTLCDGTDAFGSMQPAVLDNSPRIPDGCANPDLTKVLTSETVLLCNGTSATGTLSIDAENIKEDISIGGITGTLKYNKGLPTPVSNISHLFNPTNMQVEMTFDIPSLPNGLKKIQV